MPPVDLLTDLRRGIARVADGALDLALPAVCAGCGSEGAAICADCAPALDARLDAPRGVPVGMPADLPFPLVQLEWCTSFTGVARRAVHRMKYAGDRRVARPLGEAMARRWARAGAGGHLIVPVPASPDRVRERGYDQASLLGHVMGRALAIRVADVLERTRTTSAQFDLDRAERSANVHGVFRVASGRDVRSASARPSLDGRWVILVDDVVTTGATLASCAEVLIGAGALAVSAMTLARER